MQRRTHIEFSTGMWIVSICILAAAFFDTVR